ncbi:MAG TPA: Crp/Fnr family transcriptional regulator [Terracidiphilus sp.]|nr:Crp/Fnr family transcriptional regulator [Terracidiphilus sp.]
MNCTCKFLSGNRFLGLPDTLRPRFLAGLATSELNAVLSVATHRRFLESSVIVHEQDPAERLFLLTSGRGRHFVLTGNGRKVLLHWLTAGQIFGGAAMISTPSNYLASTEVLSDSCALVWDRETMRELVSRIPTLLDNALSIAVTEHIAWLVGAKISLSTDDAQSRIAHLLISLACGIGKSGAEGIEVPVGNEDLAAAANVTPFTISRSLSKWQKEGILRKGRNKVILRQPELLLPE